MFQRPDVLQRPSSPVPGEAPVRVASDTRSGRRSALGGRSLTGKRLLARVALSLLGLFVVSSFRGVAAELPSSSVLVVFNGNSPVSRAAADYYARARGIDEQALLELSIPLADPMLGDPADESIRRGSFDALIAEPVASRIRSLPGEPSMIVTVMGVPLRIEADATGDWKGPVLSVDAALALLGTTSLASGVDPEVANPYFGSVMAFEDWRAANPDAGLRYLVARIAGYPTPHDESGLPDSVRGLVDAAQKSADPDATWVIDEPDSRVAAVRPSLSTSSTLAPAAAIPRLMNKRVLHERTSAVVSDERAIAAYASLGNLDPDAPRAPFVGEIDGRVYPGRFDARSVAMVLVPGDARSFIAPVDDARSMLADFVELGVCGAAGTVADVAADRLARPQTFFARYAAGASAVESFYASLPRLGAANVFVGDPLMQLADPEPTDGAARTGSSNCWSWAGAADSASGSRTESAGSTENRAELREAERCVPGS